MAAPPRLRPHSALTSADAHEALESRRTTGSVVVSANVPQNNCLRRCCWTRENVCASEGCWARALSGCRFGNGGDKASRRIAARHRGLGASGESDGGSLGERSGLATVILPGGPRLA